MTRIVVVFSDGLHMISRLDDNIDANGVHITPIRLMSNRPDRIERVICKLSKTIGKAGTLLYREVSDD